MIITVTINPAVDKTIEINNFTLDQVNRVENMRKEPGGKGINVSKTVKALGRESEVFSVVAGSAGDYIKSAIKAIGLEGEFLQVAGETRTNIKITDYALGLFTDINESGPQLDHAMNDDIVHAIDDMTNEGDVLVLSGSLPMGIDKKIYTKLIEMSNDKGVLTILDASGDILENGLKAKPTIIKPNIHELESIAGYDLDSDDKIIAYVEKLISEGCVAKGVLVSNGEKGSMWITKEHVIKAKPIVTEVISTVGAGDAMVAALSIGLEEKMNDETLLRYATATAVHRISTVDLEKECMDKVRKIMDDVVLEVIK